MSDVTKVPTTREVFGAVRAAYPETLRVFSSFSDPDGRAFGGAGEIGRMETDFGLTGTDYPILSARSTWDIGEGGERLNEQHEYWLCVANVNHAAQDNAYAEGRADEQAFRKDLIAWAYGKLHHIRFTKPEDALKLDEMKLLLEHGI